MLNVSFYEFVEVGWAVMDCYELSSIFGFERWVNKCEAGLMIRDFVSEDARDMNKVGA